MAKLSELKKYLDYEFSSGYSTGQDYKTFQTKYINYLRTICRENNWQLVGILRGHYEFAVFVKNTDNKYVYISIDDVRYRNLQKVVFLDVQKPHIYRAHYRA